MAKTPKFVNALGWCDGQIHYFALLLTLIQLMWLDLEEREVSSLELAVSLFHD